jgi:hypothetical protein
VVVGEDPTATANQDNSTGGGFASSESTCPPLVTTRLQRRGVLP